MHTTRIYASGKKFLGLIDRSLAFIWPPGPPIKERRQWTANFEAKRVVVTAFLRLVRDASLNPSSEIDCEITMAVNPRRGGSIDLTKWDPESVLFCRLPNGEIAHGDSPSAPSERIWNPDLASALSQHVRSYREIGRAHV